MTVLVTGATGTVGRALIDALQRAGAPVRALTRDPGTAELPAGVEVITGDLTDPPSITPALQGVDRAHLIGFTGPRGAGGGEPLTMAPEIVARLEAAGVQRVTVLQNGHIGPMEEAVQASDLDWTLLAPVAFMANAHSWAEAIRTDGEVAEPHGHQKGAVVHEADIADVAVAALIQDGHAGQQYLITGPEGITAAEQVQILAGALGRQIGFRELTEAEAVARWRSWGFDDDDIEFMKWTWTSPVGADPVPTVRQVTGHPGRTFAEWAVENAAAFR
ncbi:MAG TPA: NAD(P)H-binding protein [Beutenbergiaceae bacterium]|nr:NAD(P)H-binding protein [Beutenbergiaceae bacterium]